MKNIQNITRARALSIGLGLLATSSPLLAQTAGVPTTPTVPATPLTPVVPAAAAPVAPARIAPAVVAPILITDPQAKALFERAVAAHKTLNNVTLTLSDGDDSQLVQFSAPDKLKVTDFDKKGNPDGFQVLNGTQLSTQEKPNDDIEYTVEQIHPPKGQPVPKVQDARASIATSGLVGSFLLANFLAGVDPFGEGGHFKASSYTMGEPTGDEGMDLMPVIVTSAKTDKHPDLTFTFYIGQQDNLVHKTAFDIKSEDGHSQTIVETYKNMQTGALPTGTFDFTPPAGAIKVKWFSPQGVTVKAGSSPMTIAAGTKDIDGKDVSLDQFKGKVTLIDFWASWCGPCKEELPNVKANYTKYHDKGFDVLGVSLDHTTPPLAKYIKDQQLPWRQVFDGYFSGPIARSYNVQAIPLTILIGKDGKIAAVGARAEFLEPEIQRALAAN